jgi:hypothetical protein
VHLAEGRTFLTLRDIHGATVKEIFDQSVGAGIHTIDCDLDSLQAGTYFAVLRNNGKTTVEKVVKIR